MGFLTRALGIQNLSIEDPSQPLLPYSVLFESMGLGRSDAGVLINEKQAMRVTTAQVCIKIISEDLASTGHEILQTFPDQSVQLARHHRLWTILHDRPNPNMSAKVFWGAMLACALTNGNGYAWIKRDMANRVIALVPLAPGKTSPVKPQYGPDKGRLLYATTQTDSGRVVNIEPADILHFMGLTFDGITGISPINSCKNAFGLALAAEKFGAQFFGNGARSTGVFSHPETLEPEAFENLKKSLYEMATGETALRPMVLEEGMTFKELTIPPNEAQFLQTRQFQKDEISGLYRVPLHLVGSLLRATNNNIEHQSLDYIRYCLRPWAVGIEQEVNFKLLAGEYTLEHNLNDMQRGDFASQTAGFQALRNIGVYSTDTILKKLRENPIGAAAGGDILTVQSAMINLENLLPGAEKPEPATKTDPNQPDDTQPFDRIVTPYRNLYRLAGERIARAKKADDTAFVRQLVHPLVTSMAEAMLAIRFGNCELTNKELACIDAAADAVAAGPITAASAELAHLELKKELP
jgi:HK97 family phage portal protein